MKTANPNQPIETLVAFYASRIAILEAKIASNRSKVTMAEHGIRYLELSGGTRHEILSWIEKIERYENQIRVAQVTIESYQQKILMFAGEEVVS